MIKMKSIVLLTLLIHVGLINSLPLFPGLPTLRPIFSFGNNNGATSEPVDNETSESSTQAVTTTKKWQMFYPNMPELPDLPSFPGLPGLPLPLPMLPFPFPLPLMFDMNNARLPSDPAMARNTFDEEEEIENTTTMGKKLDKEVTSQDIISTTNMIETQ